MQKMACRGCSIFLAIFLLISAIVPVYAVGEDYTSRSSFFSWASGSNDIVAKILGHLPVFNMTACPNSADGQHHSDSYVVDRENGYYTSVCVHCGKTFTAHASDLSAAYDDYVATLPATGYDSSGKILWQPSYSNASNFKVRFNGKNSSLSETSEDLEDIPSFMSFSSLSNGFTHSFSPSDTRKSGYLFPACIFSGFPVAGSYSIYEPTTCTANWMTSKGRVTRTSKMRTDYFFHADSATARFNYGYVEGGHVDTSYTFYSFALTFPVYEIIPDSDLVISDTYNINTRPTSITGGNYGIVGDNGQITKVEDNSTIINETNNTYYNPATGQTVPITGWSYDYSDRSYKVTLESGDTVTVTYGDENIVIKEGDTVYNIYYLIDGTGSGEVCAHEWTETSTTPATCTLSGSKLLTCSKCQQTKTESIPALGHNWQVKQTVTTQYDDTGQLTQQGYTIFECSRCHEQYKSTDGTAPPGGGSGTDPGGEDKETIWDKLGNLIGAVGSGIIDLIDAALGKVLDALIALAEKMMEKLKVVVETVLSIFDELPALFGGFLDFLVALFPFLPPELMTILTFGVIAIVFIGIIKAVRR